MQQNALIKNVRRVKPIKRGIELRFKPIKWIRILFTKKGLMKTKELQYLFNRMFERD